MSQINKEKIRKVGLFTHCGRSYQIVYDYLIKGPEKRSNIAKSPVRGDVIKQELHKELL
jgi:hypothetical protein